MGRPKNRCQLSGAVDCAKIPGCSVVKRKNGLVYCKQSIKGKAQRAGSCNKGTLDSQTLAQLQKSASGLYKTGFMTLSKPQLCAFLLDPTNLNPHGRQAYDDLVAKRGPKTKGGIVHNAFGQQPPPAKKVPAVVKAKTATKFTPTFTSRKAPESFKTKPGPNQRQVYEAKCKTIYKFMLDQPVRGPVTDAGIGINNLRLLYALVYQTEFLPDVKPSNQRRFCQLIYTQMLFSKPLRTNMMMAGARRTASGAERKWPTTGRPCLDTPLTKPGCKINTRTKKQCCLVKK